MFHAVNKIFSYRSGDPVKPRVLLLSPTGVAAVNINGNVVHSGLHAPCRGKLLPSNVANKAELRNKYLCEYKCLSLLMKCQWLQVN